MQGETNLLVDVRYEAEDELYIAEVRAISGVWASGKDHDELAVHLRTALEDYYEGFMGAEIVGVEIGPPVQEDKRVGLSHAAVKVLAGAG